MTIVDVTASGNRWPKVPEGWTYEEMCAWAYDHDAHGNLDEESASDLSARADES